MTDSPVRRLDVSVEKRRAKKHERLEKIIAFSALRQSITNNDIQILLGVSDASATRYLTELVETGRLEKSGTRASTHYRPQV